MSVAGNLDEGKGKNIPKEAVHDMNMWLWDILQIPAEKPEYFNNPPGNPTHQDDFKEKVRKGHPAFSQEEIEITGKYTKVLVDRLFFLMKQMDEENEDLLEMLHHQNPMSMWNNIQ